MANPYPALNLPLHGETDIKLLRRGPKLAPDHTAPTVPSKLEWYEKEGRTLVPRNAGASYTKFVVHYAYATPEQLKLLVERNIPTDFGVPTLTMHHPKKNGHWPPQTEPYKITKICIFRVFNKHKKQEQKHEYIGVGFDVQDRVTTAWIVMQPATLAAQSKDVVRKELKSNMLLSRNMNRDKAKEDHPGYWIAEPVEGEGGSVFRSDNAQDVRQLLHGGLNNVVHYPGPIDDRKIGTEFWVPFREERAAEMAGKTSAAAALDFDLSEEAPTGMLFDTIVAGGVMYGYITKLLAQYKTDLESAASYYRHTANGPQQCRSLYDKMWKDIEAGLRRPDRSGYVESGYSIRQMKEYFTEWYMKKTGCRRGDLGV